MDILDKDALISLAVKSRNEGTTGLNLRFQFGLHGVGGRREWFVDVGVGVSDKTVIGIFKMGANGIAPRCGGSSGSMYLFLNPGPGNLMV